MSTPIADEEYKEICTRHFNDRRRVDILSKEEQAQCAAGKLVG